MRACPQSHTLHFLAALALWGAAATGCGVSSPIVADSSQTGNANTSNSTGTTTNPGGVSSDPGGGEPAQGGGTTDANSTLVGSVINGQIVLSPELQEGSYWVDEMLNRSDITTEPTTGVAQVGAPLTLTLTVHNVTGTTSSPLTGAMVDVWQANAVGVYSDSPSQHTFGKSWLRGFQLTDSGGSVTFQTIVPGWTQGYTPRIHVRIREGSAHYNWTTELFFDDDVMAQIFATASYAGHTGQDTTNATDSDYQSACVEGSTTYPCGSLSQLVLQTDGAGNYTAAMDIYIDTTGT